MLTSLKARAVSENIASQHLFLKNELKPLFERFHGFLMQHKPNNDYVDYHSYAELPEAERFEPGTSYSSPDGIFFSAPYYDGDIGLLMPYDYIDDPELWEKELLNTTQADQLMAEQVFYRVFGYVSGKKLGNTGQFVSKKTGEKLINLYVIDEKERWSPYANYVLYIFNPSTDKMYQSIRHQDVLEGLVEPVSPIVE